MRNWSIQLSMILLMGCSEPTTSTDPTDPVEDGDNDNSTPFEAEPVGRDVVTYLGGLGTVLSAGIQLSDGSFLLGGSSPDLDWLPDETEVVELSLPASDSAASGLAILLHLSPGLEAIETAWHFPRARCVTSDAFAPPVYRVTLRAHSSSQARATTPPVMMAITSLVLTGT